MPNTIERLLTILCAPIQAAEDMLQQLLTERTIETAVGDQLDLLGKIVGQAREGLDDDDYRRYVRARIVANKSDGLIEDLILVTRLVLDDDTLTLIVENQGMAALVIRIEDGTVTNALADILIAFLNTARAGGVRIILEHATTVPAGWFAWNTVNLGFGTTADAAIGGKLIRAIDD